jgi:uncharacterized caspase-like protein
MKKVRVDRGDGRPAVLAPDFRRRRMLQGMLGAGALALAVRDAAAQPRGLGLAAEADAVPQGSGTGLVRATKQALVMGNSRYKLAPLKNPVNDANGMAEALKGAGFGVTVALELNQSAMQDAIQAYTDSLARTKSIGLFYFAGHGAQLAWRNYLIPVDAEIGDIHELRERGVDVNSLIEGIRKAGNPMNMIILDACRDNPFGSVRRLDQKGLSQLDAPPGTLLAYATAPGNTAIDGEGAHGLYTEHLLKEVRVPEAKVEDVFKRVRLGVRRRSNGLQIPWESTSLEEDFYFVPPRALSARADEEAERERKQEMALLEKRRAEEEAERKRKQEQAVREARLAAEEAERKRKQELALLEQQRIAEEAERKTKQALALKEAQRVAEEAERKRREEQALREARLAEEEAARKYQQELALREKQRAEAEAERKRKEEQALREARLAEEEAARKFKQELALREKQLAREEAERRRKQQSVSVAKPDAAELERLFDEELAIWEKIKESKAPGPLEDYLRRYPSGRFSELAQLRLDQVLAQLGEKKIEIVSAPGNPYSKGTVAANTAYKVGDRYVYRQFDLLTKLELKPFTRTVTEITETEVRYGQERRYVTDLLGNQLRFPNGAVWSPNQIVPTEFAVGKRWNTRFRVITPKGEDTTATLDVRIADRESVTVPAGTFNAFRIEARGWLTGSVGTGLINNAWNWKTWYAPDRVRQPVAFEWFNKSRGSYTTRADRSELVEFKQS